MKGNIEREIEKYADKNEEYPNLVEVSQKEYDILKKELSKEFHNELGQELKEPFKFRGCNVKINKKLSKFRIGMV